MHLLLILAETAQQSILHKPYAATCRNNTAMEHAVAEAQQCIRCWQHTHHWEFIRLNAALISSSEASEPRPRTFRAACLSPMLAAAVAVESLLLCPACNCCLYQLRSLLQLSAAAGEPSTVTTLIRACLTLTCAAVFDRQPTPSWSAIARSETLHYQELEGLLAVKRLLL